MEDAAAALAAAIGSQRVDRGCALVLQELLPGALFVKASVRCGSGLFVSGDLLQPGHTDLTVASLNRSLAGTCMVKRQAVVVIHPPARGSATAAAPAAQLVLCVPVAVRPGAEPGAAGTSGIAQAEAVAAGGSGGPTPPQQQQPGSNIDTSSGSRPLYVGALMVGAAADPSTQAPPAGLCAAVQSLADAAAPYLLLLALTKAAEMAELLRLRAADCSCCSGEEDQLQDLPLEACTPPPSPGGGAGTAGAAAVAGHAQQAAAAAEQGGAAAAEAEQQQQLQAAAAAALAQRSKLASLKAAQPDDGPSGSSSLGKGNSTVVGGPAAAAKHWPLPYDSAHAEAGVDVDAEADPKVALKAQQAAAAAAAAAGAVAPPPPQPHGPLLRFDDAALEARFAVAHNDSLSCGDLLFAIMHLTAALCLAALHPRAVLRNASVQAFVAMLGVPVLVMAAKAESYRRHREVLLTALLLAHAALLRSASVPSLLRMLPHSSLSHIPWLLRATGAEALAIFALGFKLRFYLFLPVQTVCLAMVLSALPLPCQLLQGCLPSGLGLPGAGVLLALGGLLPSVTIYKFEQRARQRFQAAHLRLRGTGPVVSA